MSIEATRWVYTLKGLRSTQKFILFVLADRAGSDNTCWPSLRRIAEDTSFDERTVNTAIREMCEYGLISRVEVPGRGYTYTLHIGQTVIPPSTNEGTPPSTSAPRILKNPHEPKKNPKKSARHPDGFRASGGTLVCDKDLAKDYSDQEKTPGEKYSPYYLPVKSPDMSQVAYIKAENWRVWVETFGLELCLACLKNAYRWTLDNPANAKTPRGIHKFLGDWIAREQDSPFKTKTNTRASPQPVRSFTDMANETAWAELEAELKRKEAVQ